MVDDLPLSYIPSIEEMKELTYSIKDTKEKDLAKCEHSILKDISDKYPSISRSEIDLVKHFPISSMSHFSYDFPSKRFTFTHRETPALVPSSGPSITMTEEDLHVRVDHAMDSPNLCPRKLHPADVRLATCMYDPNLSNALFDEEMIAFSIPKEFTDKIPEKYSSKEVSRKLMDGWYSKASQAVKKTFDSVHSDAQGTATASEKPRKTGSLVTFRFGCHGMCGKVTMKDPRGKEIVLPPFPAAVLFSIGKSSYSKGKKLDEIAEDLEVEPNDLSIPILFLLRRRLIKIAKGENVIFIV
ncbi:hypothetical protein ADUPG1_013666 [Aduncisulcus paluster]|uniref:Uncharacterized protein n=1 Tax=Aduncisulcus paluster TaxID=2918883 RepID=A0ABQ5K3R8_9EUKA|nr:hypothetical protein ADUPG1_013666 [Aduncisulcus paluster]